MSSTLRPSRFEILMGGVALASLILIVSQGAFTQSASPQSSEQSSSRQVLRAESNLVLVRVIVRDAHGSPVTGLTQKDFELSDDRRRQEITYFSAETPGAAPAAPNPSASVPSAPASSAENASPAATSPSYVAIFFDDYHMDFGDLVQIRTAAQRYLSKSLEAGAHVGIFSASGNPALEFTADRTKLMDALSKVHFDRRFVPHVCPNLPAEFAQQVVDYIPFSGGGMQASKGSAASAAAIGLAPENPQALNEDNPITIAETVASQQHCPPSPQDADLDIQLRARDIVFQNRLGVQASLVSLENLVQRMAQTPGGRRTVALVSGGMFDQEVQRWLSQLTDRALRGNVVINSLDARGLYAELPGGDLSENALTPEIQIKVNAAVHHAKSVASDPLGQIARDTGGVFVQNTNDMAAGLQKITGLQAPAYVLGFSPDPLKSDGKFHALHVKLVRSRAHWELQARRGYFAPGSGAPAETEQREKLELAIFSQEPINGLPIQLSTLSSKADPQNFKLNVTVEADMRGVQFRKDQGRNADDVTLTVVVFDSDGNYVTAKQQVTKLRMSDVALADLKRSGGETSLDLTLKPGAYTVRAVVGESASNQLGAASRNLVLR
jgi:VWFA-related protein